MASAVVTGGVWAARVVMVLVALVLATDVWGNGQANQGPTAPVPPGVAVVPSARRAATIAVVPIEGRIDRFMTQSIIRRLREAEAMKADAVVLELDSADSDYGTVIEARAAIAGSGIANRVAWVRGKALGGAGLVAMGAREIVAGERGELGELIDPDWLTRRGRRIPGPGRTTASNSAVTIGAPALLGVIETARATGRDEALAQAMALSGTELWLVESTGTGERRVVTADGYAALFGSRPMGGGSAMVIPGRSTPQLVGAGVAGPINVPIMPSPGGSMTGGIVPGSGGAVGSTPTELFPISPAAADLLATQTTEGFPAATRPPLSTKDAGAWRLVGYASDGSGAVVLRGKQAVDFGVASKVVANEGELKDFFAATKVVRFEQSWAEHTARFLAQPTVRGVLIAIFLIAMFVEMTHAGMVIPGLIAAGALILIMGPNFIGGLSNWWAVGAVVAGILLLALELFVLPGFGIAGVLGLISLFVGLVFTFVPTGGGGVSTPEAQEALARGAVTVLLSTVTAVFGIFFLVRQLGTMPLLKKYTLQSPAPGEVDEAIFGAMRPEMDDAEAMVGDEGVTASLLRPAGKAIFGEGEARRIVDVVAAGGYLEEGTPVRVVSADKFRVVVERVAEERVRG
jgi:membrane-bound serine protease (ClpP class)